MSSLQTSLERLYASPPLVACGGRRDHRPVALAFFTSFSARPGRSSSDGCARSTRWPYPLDDFIHSRPENGESRSLRLLSANERSLVHRPFGTEIGSVSGWLTSVDHRVTPGSRTHAPSAWVLWYTAERSRRRGNLSSSPTASTGPGPPEPPQALSRALPPGGPLPACAGVPGGSGGPRAGRPPTGCAVGPDHRAPQIPPGRHPRGRAPARPPDSEPYKQGSKRSTSSGSRR